MTLGNVPAKYLSSLRNIHLVLLSPTKLVKKYGFNLVFKNLTDDLHTLETVGLSVLFAGNLYHFFGTLVSISADNLASHELGGFRMCFSSGRICRFCMITHEDMSSHLSETANDFPSIRTSKTHKIHVASVIKDSSLISAYGVRGNCCFSNLLSFDPTTHLPADCMHDGLEGWIPKSITTILKSFFARKILSLTEFDARLASFKFGSNDRKDKPPLLGSNFNTKGVRGSAAENYTLLRTLPYIIGDLVPVGDVAWELYILLKTLCDIVFAPAVEFEWLALLEQLIKDHHSLLIELNCNAFTPKMHFLCHYPRLISVYGPLRHLWCMRYEAYHQYLKNIVSHTGNFINICKTVAERNQLRKCWLQSGNDCLESPAEPEKMRECLLSGLPVSVQVCISNFFPCASDATVMSVKSVTILCVKYSIDDFFVIDMTAEDIPVFICVKFILSFEGSWCMIGRLTISESFIRHYQCYTIRDAKQWIAISPGTELDYHALNSYIVDVNGEQLTSISLRHRIAKKNNRS